MKNNSLKHKMIKTNLTLFFTTIVFLFSFQNKPLYSQDLDPDDIRKIMLEGIENMEKENYRSAIELFDRGRNNLNNLAIKIDEKNANIVKSLELTRQAESLINQNDYSSALDLLNEAIQLDNNNIEAYKFRGSVRLILEQRIDRRRDQDYISLLNDYTNAIRIVDRRINQTQRRAQERVELEKEKAKILINRAYVKMQSRRLTSFHSAIDDYTEAVRYDDQNWDGYLGRAVAYNRISEHSREIRDYLRAIELIEEYQHRLSDEEWADLYLRLAMAYVSNRDNRNAFIYAEKSYNLGNTEAEKIMERTRP